MRLSVLFLLLAVAIGYDAVVHDGAYTKSAWARVLDAGQAVQERIAERQNGAPADTGTVPAR